jgi:hypothetical protein
VDEDRQVGAYRGTGRPDVACHDHRFECAIEALTAMKDKDKDKNKNKDNLPPAADRRPGPRTRVLLSGVVAYGKGAYSFDCAFRNLSATGARIVMGKNMQFPSEFFLINVRDRVAYDCKLVWNKGGEVGVNFKATVPLSGAVDPGLAYLKKLWLAKAAS